MSHHGYENKFIIYWCKRSTWHPHHLTDPLRLWGILPACRGPTLHEERPENEYLKYARSATLPRGFRDALPLHHKVLLMLFGGANTNNTSNVIVSFSPHGSRAETASYKGHELRKCLCDLCPLTLSCMSAKIENKLQMVPWGKNKNSGTRVFVHFSFFGYPVFLTHQPNGLMLPTVSYAATQLLPLKGLYLPSVTKPYIPKALKLIGERNNTCVPRGLWVFNLISNLGIIEFWHMIQMM